MVVQPLIVDMCSHIVKVIDWMTLRATFPTILFEIGEFEPVCEDNTWGGRIKTTIQCYNDYGWAVVF